MSGDEKSEARKWKSEGSSDGIQLRKGKKTETIRILFRYKGQLCRETLKRDHTKANIAYAVRRRGEIINAIDRGDFDYDVFFPNSVRAKKTAAAAAMAAARETAQVVTVGQLLREYLLVAQRNLELSSYNCYQQVARTHLFPKWDNKPVVELTTKEIRTWIMLLTGKSKTIQLILTPMRNALEQAVIDEVIDMNPFDSIKLAKIVTREQRTTKFKADPFDIDEIEAILAAFEREQERNMFGFAFGTGMRPSEYIALEWTGIDFLRDKINVEGAFVDGASKDTAKTDAGLRNIDMRKFALDALLAQQSHTQLAGGLVFLNPLHGEQWTGDKAVRERWRRILLLAGVRYRNPYQTRHTFASSLLMLGANPMYVATQMGHADTTMITKNYGKWISAGIDGDKRKRLEKIYSQIDPKRQNEFPVFESSA